MVSGEATGESWFEFERGEIFEGYRIERVVGHGGMGIVYEATQLSLDRSVALKVIAPTFSRDPTYCARFRREAHLAAGFEHPSVLPIYDYSEGPGELLYLSLKLVRGVDLRERLSEAGPMTASETLRLLGPVAEALDAAHKAGLVHRDVKPANVLLEQTDGAPRVYLTDFGLAKRVEAELGETTTVGEVVGTPQYMAPEQICGGPVDGRADVYAFGCLLYRCLVGDVPFPRPTGQATLLAHLHEPPPRPSTAKPGLPEIFDLIILRALEKDPERRARSATTLVRRAAADLSATEPPATSLTQRDLVAPRRAGPPPAPRHPAPPREDHLSGTVLRRRVRAPDDDLASRASPPPAKRGNSGFRIAMWTVAVIFLIAAGAVVALIASERGGDSSVESELLSKATATGRVANVTRSLVQRMGVATDAEGLAMQYPRLDKSVSEARALEKATLRTLPKGDSGRHELVLAQRSLAQTGIKLRGIAEAPGAEDNVGAVAAARTAYGRTFDRLGATTRLIQHRLSRADRLSSENRRTLEKVAHDLPAAKSGAEPSFDAIKRLVANLGGA